MESSSSRARLGFGALLALLLAGIAAATGDQKEGKKAFCYHSRKSNKSIYNYDIQNVHANKSIDWTQYKDQVDSIRDFKVLGVPCNQFGLQEPGNNGTEILNCLKHVRPGGGFEPNFELAQKVDVNGVDEDPLYTFLKAYCPSPTQYFADKEKLFYKDLRSSDIRWNFEKFLIDRQGIPVMRFSEKYPIDDIIPDIKQLLMTPEELARK